MFLQGSEKSTTNLWGDEKYGGTRERGRKIGKSDNRQLDWLIAGEKREWRIPLPKIGGNSGSWGLNIFTT